MSKSKTLRALVNERLTAAAEEIFALFERTLAEYEEELRRSKQERGLQEPELNPREDTQAFIPSQSPPGLNLDQEITAQMKEESEEDQPSVSEESSSVYVKEEEFLQEQPEHREETQAEDICSEDEGDPEHSYYTGNGWNWEPQFICKEDQMDLEAGAAQHTGEQIRDGCSKLSSQNNLRAAFSAENNREMSETREGAEDTYKHLYNCSAFARKSNLELHKRLHPNKTVFASVSSKSPEDVFRAHKRTCTGKRRFSCHLCERSFDKASHLNIHMRSHTGERPFSCLFCEKAFSVKSNLKRHLRIHTEESRLCIVKKHQSCIQKHF